MSLTTVADVALFLNMDVTDLSTKEIAQIEMTIPLIEGVIANYCGWELLATDYTDKRFDGNGTNTLDVRLYPVNTLESVKVRETDGTFTDVTAGVEILEGGLLQFLPYATTAVTTFTAGVKNWFLTFNAGFEDTAIPKALAYAANYLVAINFSKIVAGNIGESEEKFGEVILKTDNLELPRLVQTSLDRYRLVSII